MGLCYRCDEEISRGKVIDGRDYCLSCVEDVKAKKDLAFVNQYPHGRLRVHNLLDLWKTPKAS